MPAGTPPLHGPTIARVAATLLTGTALLAAAPPRAIAQDPCTGASAVPSAQTLGQAAGAVVCLVNAERARNGLRPWRGDSDLVQAAGRHSRGMVRHAFFSHVSPGGARLTDRLHRSGYIHGHGAWQAGETLGWGTGTLATPEAIVAAWVASPGHHEILLGREFREVGVGVAAGAPQPTAGTLGGATYTLDAGVIGS